MEKKKNKKTKEREVKKQKEMKVQGTYTADSQFSNPVEYNPMCEKEEEIKSK